MEPFVDVQVHREYWGWIGSINYIITTSILLLMSIVHGIKVYHDLNTVERDSLSHKRSKPERDKAYKVMIYLSEIQSVLWTVTFSTHLFEFALRTGAQCKAELALSGTLGVSSKVSMYLLFLARLHSIYGSSIYAYSTKCIKISASLIIIYNIFLVCTFWYFWKSSVQGYSSIDKYPNLCDGGLEPITAAFYIFGDMTTSVGVLIAFIVPLRKTMRDAKELAKNNNQSLAQRKVFAKITYVGRKTAILTVVAIFTSFGIAMFSSATELNWTIAWDGVINTICVLFMTPYYPDNIYYKKWCILCVLCCGGKNEIEEEDKDRPNIEQSTRLETQTRTTGHIDDHSKIKVNDDTNTATTEMTTPSSTTNNDNNI